MDVIIDEIPYGAIPNMSVDIGAILTYIDTNHEIREVTLYEDHPHRTRHGFWMDFSPSFMIPDISQERMDFLIEALKREAPKAEEIRILRTNDAQGRRIFMCAVTDP